MCEDRPIGYRAWVGKPCGQKTPKSACLPLKAAA